jgi:hypothetical protein
MGLCLSQAKYDTLLRDNIKFKERIIDLTHEISYLKKDKERFSIDNIHLQRKIIEMELKIENYGNILCGEPCRVTPTSYDISKRIGGSTV